MTTRRPTICQVLHSLVVGGAEVLADRLARRLGDRYRFVAACLDELGTLGQALRDDGFTVEVIGRTPGLDRRCARRLAQFWRREQVDLIHAHQYTPFFYSAAARGLRRRPPILLTEHGRHFPDVRRRKRFFFNRLVLGRRDRVVSVGEAVRRALIANDGFPARRVGRIYNGIDCCFIADTSSVRREVREEIGLTEEHLILIQVARLNHLKDHATALRTMERIAARRDDVRLVLVGEGPEQEAIQREIGKRRLESRVCLLGLRDDVPRLLQAADLFLLTSISEGIPVTLIEAMAAGLPVVSTDVGGVAEVVQHERSALLAAAGDDAALAAAVLQLAADDDLRRRMGAEGKRRAAEVFSEETMHEAYCRLYEEMLHE
ncbi:MAG: glycosyltransferase [Planctomycetes bacterium]|nr:glycosyltransferase [Planctomycetota bacterium]